MARKGEDATIEDVASAMPKMSVPQVPDSDIGNPSVQDADDDGFTSPNDILLSRLTIALEALSNKENKSERENSALDRLAVAFERMAEAQLEGANRVAKATRSATRPSNEAPPKISVFNPRGDKDFPKPALKADFYLPWHADADSMTREEIELLNLFMPGEYVVRRIDNTKIKVTVRATYRLDSDQMDKVLVNHDTAFNNDHQRLMPSNWIRQIAEGNPKNRADAKMVLTMDEEADLILAGKLSDGSTPADKKVVSVGE